MSDKLTLYIVVDNEPTEIGSLNLGDTAAERVEDINALFKEGHQIAKDKLAVGASFKAAVEGGTSYDLGYKFTEEFLEGATPAKITMNIDACLWSFVALAKKLSEDEA